MLTTHFVPQIDELEKREVPAVPTPLPASAVLAAPTIGPSMEANSPAISGADQPSADAASTPQAGQQNPESSADFANLNAVPVGQLSSLSLLNSSRIAILGGPGSNALTATLVENGSNDDHLIHMERRLDPGMIPDPEWRDPEFDDVTLFPDDSAGGEPLEMAMLRRSSEIGHRVKPVVQSESQDTADDQPNQEDRGDEQHSQDGFDATSLDKGVPNFPRRVQGGGIG